MVQSGPINYIKCVLLILNLFTTVNTNSPNKELITFELSLSFQKKKIKKKEQKAMSF